MNNERQYTSLKKLVGDEFTVEAVKGYQWKRWDNESRRVMVAEKYEQGFSKKYGIETDKGFMDISGGQLGNMFEGVQKNGVSDLRGKTFHVKSNGKEGMEIRYFLNPVWDKNKETTNTPSQPEKQHTEPQNTSQDVPDDEPIDISDIPF